MPLAEVHVTLKPALFDAQGETIGKALQQLGHAGVRNVRIGKYITLEVDGVDPSALQGQLDLMCQQLLANPVIENYEITLSGADAGLPLQVGEQVTMLAPPVVTAEAVTTSHGVAATSTPRTDGLMGTVTSPQRGLEPVATPGGVTDPFQVDFRSYEAMATEAKLALRTLALRKYGMWIEAQLNARGASWILCLGQDVTQSGASLDDYPSDQQLLKLGVQSDRVPWVFTRPQI